SGEQGGGVAFGAYVAGTICGLALILIEKLFKRSLPVEESEEVEDGPATPIRQTHAPVRQARAPLRAQLKTAPAAVAAVEAPAVFLYSGGAQSGPFTPGQIQEMFLNGVMPSDAFYWQEGMTDWQSAEELRPSAA